MEFLSKLSKIINSGQSRSVILTGNVNDLYFDGENYVPLVKYLSKSYNISPNGNRNGITQLIYEINNTIRVVGNKEEIAGIWEKYKGNERRTFDQLCDEAAKNSAVAFEFLRQLTIFSRRAYKNSESHNNLLIIIESADFLVPEEKISAMSLHDRHRVAILQDWFSDLDFMHGADSVILIVESRSSLHSRISTLPQIIHIDISIPDLAERQNFINWYASGKSLPDNFAKNTAGLSLHALRQLLCKEEIVIDDVLNKVEDYIISQLGEDVVEFKRPTHTLSDVVGFSNIKKFIRNEMIPRIKGEDSSAISGAAVGGPIGGGKTFIFEALASELGVPVLVLKNLRSQWYGQTDVLFERLKRTITALEKVVIFLDEADTQLGGVGADTHETERRLTGKIQSMMSDPQLKGKVIWLLMTARINLLSPDIRRPGRAGDLIIAVLDPEGDDLLEFIDWVLGGIETSEAELLEFHSLVRGYSAAGFSALKSLIKAKKCSTLKEILVVINDTIPPDIDETREYQALQAKVNCTRQSLLFSYPVSREELNKHRISWKEKIRLLESRGIK